jgi:hypothetical protein
LLAERTDQTGVGDAVVAAREGVRATKETLHSALVGHDFGVPALEALKGAVLARVKPAPEPSSLEAERRRRALARLQLGPTQAALYQSDMVLNQATRLRQGQIANLQTVVVVLGGAGLVLLLAWAQAGGGRSTQN